MRLVKEESRPMFMDGLESYFIDNMKRHSLKQQVAKIERVTGIYTRDFESLCNELVKKEVVSVFSFLTH